MNETKTFLESKNFILDSFELAYLPKSTVTLSGEEEKQEWEKMLTSLEENEDVQEVYHNHADIE